MNRWLRTVASLRSSQVLWRLPHRVLGMAAPFVPASGSPRLRAARLPDASRRLATCEAVRVVERWARLGGDPALCRYERVAGLDLGADPPTSAPSCWAWPEATDPWPSAVRARRLAVAVGLGADVAWLGPELARAARAVLLRPEWHLGGNHLAEDALGLVCAGAVGHGAEAAAWRQAGLGLLHGVLRDQFLDDGAHVERSATYHASLVAAGVEAIALLGGDAPSWLRSTMSRALGWLLAVRAPDGTVPLFNDAALDAMPDLDAVLALAVAVGLPVEAGSLGASGWRVLRSTDGRAFLVVDAAPDGAPHQPGHAHADALGFELWVDGARVVVDYGVEAYAAGPGRARTRATASHSTVTLAGQDSAEVWASFRVGRRQGARIEVDAPDRVVAVHDGYRHLPGRPLHRRSWMLSDGRLEVRDEVTSDVGGASRLRLDAREAARVTVRCEGARPSTGRWFPRHGEAREAVVWEAPFRREGGWTLDWG